MPGEVHHASIIIDDPLLRENYGFLNYRKLLDLMDQHNFCTTIAFIPFNFNRTDKGIADLFKERPDRFSLCVHGCDHVKGEFGATDPVYLDRKVKLATRRMLEHEKRTGIPFSRVMVFPQGIFSNEALDALKKNDYLAAVNTEALPFNGPISSDFPFFLRYRPEDVTDRLPEPAFVVLHHDYFKNGYARLAEFVDGWNCRFENLRWGSVGSIIRHFVPADEVNDIPPDADLRGWQLNGYKQTVKIYMRRYASEWRDNFLCKNDFLWKCGKKAKNLIKM